MEVDIEKGWLQYLEEEFEKEYMLTLQSFLSSERDQGKIIYPKKNEVFSVFNSTPFEKVKVVIIGQDPYHGPGQCHGPCFSVKKGVKIPPSLVNIYKEMKSDLNIMPASHGYLIEWANQGVFLLNNCLTVEHRKAGSHKGKGWEIFTDKVIEVLNVEKKSLVFLLWGAPAQKKAAKVDTTKHLILKAPHPSPLSSYRGFFGCKHFSKTNQFLKEKGLDEINWELT